MSSLCGLNAAPSTAIRRPTIEPPQTSRARSTIRTRRRMLIESTSRRKRQRLVDAELAGAGHERPDVLGQAAAAEADAGVEEPAADPLVVPDRVGQLRHVGAGGLAQLGHRVDEGDLGGQERVGGHLDQLGGGQVGLDLRGAGGQRRGVHLVEDARGPLAALARAEAVDQPVGVQRVLDGVALAQELRVPDQLGAGLALLDPLGDRLGGADRDRGLADHHVARLEQRQDRVDRRADVGQVGGVLAALLRRADADEVHDRVRGPRADRW